MIRFLLITLVISLSIIAINANPLATAIEFTSMIIGRSDDSKSSPNAANQMLTQATDLTSQNEPDLNMDPLEMIRFRGYVASEHFVVTRDCYILRMFRIQHPAYVNVTQRPILIGHGILGNAVNFMFNSVGGTPKDTDDRNMAFMLARRGYDVWLCNFRGSFYSKTHFKLNSSKDKSFWDFSFDEHALLDLPSFISHIQQITSQTQVGYVGFSQGTLVMFYLLAQRPEMAEVIRPIIQIAPITRLTHARHPVRNLSANILLKQLLRTMSEININNRLTNFAIDIICRSQYIFLPMICGNVMKLAMGHHNEMNYTRLPVYLKHFPDSTSALNLMHFSQMIQSPQLHMFNFGSPQQNQQCYSQPEPPIIDYTRIRSNDIHLIYSSDDMFSDVKDIEEFKKSVPVRMSEYKVPVKKWSHIDFMISKDLDKYTNQVVLNRINSHFDNENVILSTEPKPVIPSYSHETCRAQTKCELGNHEWQT